MLEATVYDLNGSFLFLPFRVTFSKITFTQLTQYSPWQCTLPCIHSQHWDSTEKLPLNHDSLIPSDTDATSLKLLFPVRVLESYLLTANTGFRGVTLIFQWNIKEWFLGNKPWLWKDKQWATCPLQSSQHRSRLEISWTDSRVSIGTKECYAVTINDAIKWKDAAKL